MTGRLRLLLTAGLVAGAVAAVAHTGGALDALENASIDRRFEARGAQPPSGMVFIAIDDVTFSRLGLQWPFPRSLHGKAIAALHRAGAREIVYDVQFTEPTKPREDFALYDAIKRAGGAVLATTEMDPNGRSMVLGGDENLARADAVAAAANLPEEERGVIRRFTWSRNNMDTIAVAVAKRLGYPVRAEAFEAGGSYIDFRGPKGTVPTYSFSALVKGQVDPRALRGKIVVVGASAPSLQDLHATSAGNELMSGPEIQANAIWTLMHGLPLRTAPDWLDLLAVFAMSLIVPLLALRIRAMLAALAVPVLGVAYVALAQVAFEHGTIVAVVAPLGGLLLAAVATVAVSHMLETIRRQHVGELNRRLEEEVRIRTSELRATELEVIQRLGQAVESRDEETGGHIGRMSELCHRLALAAGVDPEDAEVLRHASAMHDVGKIAIPDAILGKPGPLTDAEWEVMKSHTTIGADLLAGSRSPLVQMGEVIARTHHERWDGSGYPAGLAGEDIPLVGRICAVCDVFDALTSPRPYKHAWRVDEALAEIAAESGRHFDPRLAALLPGVVAGGYGAVVDSVNVSVLL
ncbi:MAG TPA: CHASE2 domain-containing protein [Solirubrobacteraceae bacterium]|nr:CHASE2 domain-containing protein [Solirubrobacteraceae bacterium]